MSRYDGKVVIVTGAAQGIGLQYATSFAEAGATAVLTDIQAEAVETAAEKLVAGGHRAIGLGLDIGSSESFAQVVGTVIEQYGQVDVLMNNAAIYAGYLHYTLLDVPLDYWNTFIDVNLTGVLNGVQAVAPHMKSRRYGRIINQSSGGANSPRNQYSVTKLGVQGVSLGLARSLGRYGITVNCLAPGITDTAATRGHYTDVQLSEMVAARTLLNRVGTVQEMADAALWLASDEAALVTGQVIHVDAGFVANPA